MGRILVTGGEGFIGRAVCLLLHQNGHEVVSLDDFSRAIPADSARDYAVVGGSVCDYEVISGLFRNFQFDCVVHLAGKKSVRESWIDPVSYWETNVGGTLNMLRVLAENKVRRLVFASSCSIFGSSDLRLSEGDALNPQSPYAQSKRAVEEVLVAVSAMTSLSFVSLRFFNVIGAWEEAASGDRFDSTDNLLPLALRSALLGNGSFNVYGNQYPTPDGTCVRDYVDVVDLANAHCASVDYLLDGGASASFNIGSGSGTSVLEMLRLTEAVTGKPFTITTTDPRLGDPAQAVANPQLANSVLGWKASTPLQASIRNSFNWMRSRSY